MSYIVLARKYRPQNFDELVGQGHVSTTLKNALSSNRIAHAYLFSGPRGVGKTSAARILAKALNCQKGIGPSPCNKCANCEEITKGNSMDVIEIDGASNRGIDEIRSLREKVRLAPVGGRYRIYIIDEVHMLTKEAFNALLKTLEEPPDQVVFVFATTEPYKVPVTILSRCQKFDFRRISVQEIVKHLKEIANKEKIDVEEEAFYLIARSAEGSMRDSQSLLDQAISYSGEKITQKNIQEFLGLFEDEMLQEFCRIVINKDSNAALFFIHGFLEKGYDLNQFIKNTLDYFRHILIAKVVSDSNLNSLSNLSPLQLKNISEHAKYFTKERLMEIIRILNDTELEIRRSNQPRILLELALIRITQDEEIKKETEEKTNDGSGSSGNKNKIESKPAAVKDNKEREKEGNSKANPVKPCWEKVIQRVKEKKVMLGNFLEHCEIIRDENNLLVLGFRPENKFHKDNVEEKNNLTMITKIIEELTGSKVVVKCDFYESNPSSSGTNVQKEEKKENFLTERKKVLSDPILKSSIDTFGGEIVEIKKSKHKGSFTE